MAMDGWDFFLYFSHGNPGLESDHGGKYGKYEMLICEKYSLLMLKKWSKGEIPYEKSVFFPF